jgi:hypothetical protein
MGSGSNFEDKEGKDVLTTIITTTTLLLLVQLGRGCDGSFYFRRLYFVSFVVTMWHRERTSSRQQHGPR